MSLTHIQLYALPIVLGVSLIEAVVLARRKPGAFDWYESGLSVFDLLGRQVLTLLPLSLATPVFALAWQHRIHTIALDGWAAAALLFFGQEFCYYWYHRAAHRIRFFWATHAVHHSPNQLTLSTAYRLGWTGKLTGTALFFTPLVWIGFDPVIVLGTLTLNLLYQFWIHATWIPRLGPLEYVLNTPSAHRVHHAANLEYLDGNYGGVLIVFDRLFGTYIAERADLPCRYGLVTPMRSRNPLVIEFHQWIALGRDLMHARGFMEILGLVFAPPGWRANGNGQTTEDLRRNAGLLPEEAMPDATPLPADAA